MIPFFLTLLSISLGFANESCKLPVGSVVDGNTLANLQALASCDLGISSYYLSPTKLRDLDERQLAELIVAHQEKICEESRGSGTGADLGSQSELIMMVNSAHLSSIAKYGLQNQHNTGTTGGCNCQEFRFNNEMFHAGLRLPYTSKMRQILPKYAVLNVKRDNFGEFELPTKYGNFAFVFKDKVKKRATWSGNDSLIGTVERADNPPRALSYRAENSKDGLKCTKSRYCEAQIWGPLDLSDVSYVMVPKDKSLSPEDTALLQQLGLRVHTYEEGPYRAPSPTKQAGQFTRSIAPLIQGTGEISGAKKLSRTEIELALSKAKSSAEKGILTSQLYPLLSNAELMKIAKVAAPIAETTDSDGPVEERARALSELAMRPKTDPTLTNYLLEKLPIEKSTFVKSQLLLGLSELPWEKIRPYVVDILKTKTEMNGTVVLNALVIAMEHPEDKEMAALVQNAQAVENPASDYPKFKELKKRLLQSTYCTSKTTEHP